MARLVFTIFSYLCLVSTSFGQSATPNRDLVRAMRENTAALQVQTNAINELADRIRSLNRQIDASTKITEVLEKSVRDDIGAHRGTQMALEINTSRIGDLNQSASNLTGSVDRNTTSISGLADKIEKKSIDAVYVDMVRNAFICNSPLCDIEATKFCSNIGYAKGVATGWERSSNGNNPNRRIINGLVCYN